MLRCSPRQTGTIELRHRAEVEWETNAFPRCKASVKSKRIDTRLVDSKIGAVRRMADGRAVRQRIPIKEQRRLTRTRLRRRRISRQQLYRCGACTCRTRGSGSAGRTGGTAWTCRYMFLYTTLLLRKLESILAFYIAFLLSKASNSRRLFSIYSSIRRCWSAKVNSIVISPFL